MARKIILCTILIINIAVCHSFLFGSNKKSTKNIFNIKNDNTNQNQNSCNCGSCGKRKREVIVYDKVPCQFEKFDVDNDGSLTYEEFASQLNKLAPNPQFTDLAIFISLDFNDDDKISKSEFMYSPGYQFLVKLNIMEECSL